MRGDPARRDEARDLSLLWSARLSLTPRILAVNIIALAMLAGGFFYLDSYRTRILDGRIQQASREARLIADALARVPPAHRDELLLEYARDTGGRLRLYDFKGRLIADTREMGSRNAILRDPDKDGWQQDVARFLDAAIDTVVGAVRAPLYREKPGNRGLEWPDVRAATDPRIARASVWRAPDRTPVITAASAYAPDRIVFTTANAIDITQTVRIERFRLTIVLALVSLLSILLSLFLARTIVRPLRGLARAAVRVRLGRAREVVVPRLPSRRDEIGTLARALSDMTQALRERIDAGEHFAADVTHELKNPIASVRSAIEGLGRVQSDEQRTQLLAIADEDVRRLDRLVSDISEASRVDAQLSRTLFEPVDVGMMIESMLAGRAARAGQSGPVPRIAFARPRKDTTTVAGDGHRLERAIDNIIDNAISFSPPDGLVCIAATRLGDEVHVRVDDDGPGIEPAQREAIFRRFHSERPKGEAFGRHSGLGLAIARTIIEGHGGTISARDRDDGKQGASLLITLPARDGSDERA